MQVFLGDRAADRRGIVPDLERPLRILQVDGVSDIGVWSKPASVLTAVLKSTPSTRCTRAMTSPAVPQPRHRKHCLLMLTANLSRPEHRGHGPTSSWPKRF